MVVGRGSHSTSGIEHLNLHVGMQALHNYVSGQSHTCSFLGILEIYSGLNEKKPINKY